MKILVECHEFVEDENGGHWITYTKEKEVLHPEREEKLCRMCNFNAYPECLNTCSVGTFKKDKK